VLDLFGSERQKSSAAYVEFVRDGAREYLAPAPDP
jgi:hypothetical protein